MDNQQPQNDASQPIAVAQQPTPPNKKFNWKGFIIALAIVGLLDIGALTVIHSENKTPTVKPQLQTKVSPTPDPTANWKTYTGDKFSFKYPPDIQVNTSEFKYGTLMIGGTGTLIGTGIDFPPEQNDLLKNAITNGTAFKPKETKANQGTYNIIRNDFKTIRLGSHYFVRDYPASQGCLCDNIEYVTMIGNQLIYFSMAKAVSQPLDPKAPTLAPYQVVPSMSTEDYRKLVTTDKETLLKKQFGNIEAILATLTTTQ